MIVTFPPDSVMMSADFDPAKAGAEHLAAAPGIAETFEMENPGMHTTPTVDYAVVLDGESGSNSMTKKRSTSSSATQ